MTSTSPEYQAWSTHVDEHGCGCPTYDRGCTDPRHAEGHKCRGARHCPEAQRLEALLPEPLVVLG